MTRRLIAHLLVGTIAVVAIEYPSAAGAQPAVVLTCRRCCGHLVQGGTIDHSRARRLPSPVPRRGSAPQWTRMGPSSLQRKTWSLPESIDAGGGGFTSVPADGDILRAVDQNDNALTYNGSSWSKPVRIDSSDSACFGVCARRLVRRCGPGGFASSIRQVVGRFRYVDAGAQGLDTVMPKANLCIAVDAEATR